MSKFLLSKSANCFIALCIDLYDSVTFLSMFSASIDEMGSFIQLSCHLTQSEHVIHKFLYGSNSLTSRVNFSYLKKINFISYLVEIDIQFE
jgi:hypothetical protein